MGLTNVEIMVPFVRTLGQAKAVNELLSKQGLSRGSVAGYATKSIAPRADNKK